jgi:peptide/nickel transport system ATP-binding protein
MSAAPPTSPVLAIENYSLDYATLRHGAARVLDGVDLTIGKGEVVGLVGESGSGKSSLAWAIMRHLPRNAVEASGTLRLGGLDLRGLDAKICRPCAASASAWCSRTPPPR